MARGAGLPSGSDVWFRRARRYLRIAKSNLEDGYADVASFYAQQAAEFALKALQIHRQGVQERTHDLTRLARVLSAPPRILRFASNVTLAYVVARYPDVGGGRITRRRAESYIDDAGRIVRWVRREMV